MWPLLTALSHLITQIRWMALAIRTFSRLVVLFVVCPPLITCWGHFALLFSTVEVQPTPSIVPIEMFGQVCGPCGHISFTFFHVSSQAVLFIPGGCAAAIQSFHIQSISLSL